LKSISHGMRRAKKGGGYGARPFRHINKIYEAEKKHIAIKEDQVSIMRWVFQEIAKRKLNTEQI
jgi:site-specific DNA recombinase